MPAVRYYEHYDFITKDENQLTIWKIHWNSFAYGRLVAQGKDFQIWCTNEEIENLKEEERESYKDKNECLLTYVLLFSKDLNRGMFDEDFMLNTEYVGGYIQIKRNLIPIKNRIKDNINKRYCVKKDDYLYLKTAEIVLSYVVEKHRKNGWGRLLYKWVIFSEKVIQTGWCLHSSKVKATGSLGIWKNWLTKSYNTLVYDFTKKKFLEYKETSRRLWSTKNQVILATKGKIWKS